MLPNKTKGSIWYGRSKEQYQDVLHSILARNIERFIDLNRTIVTNSSGINNSQAFFKAARDFFHEIANPNPSLVLLLDMAEEG